MSLKNPNWFDRQDRELYEKLFNIGYDMNEEEWAFFKTMYHMEEFACGLDGD